MTKEEYYIKCPMCGGLLCWQSDGNANELYPGEYADDNEAIVEYYVCDTCGREYEICDPPKELRETLDYWKQDA